MSLKIIMYRYIELKIKIEISIKQNTLFLYNHKFIKIQILFSEKLFSILNI